MKKLIAALLALISSVVFAATTVPVQLLNPTGSTAGQAIVSTGASSAPAWGGVPVGGLAAIAANTVIGNATGSSAVPTAITVAGCNGAAQALQWTNGTGFGCNSAVATSGANGNITSLTALTSITSPPNITGVTNGSSAPAGSVGEFVTATGSAVSLTTGTPANIASISLTAGDWDVWGNIEFDGAATTVITTLQTCINTVSATLVGAPNRGVMAGLSNTAQAAISIGAPKIRLSLTTTTTVFLVGSSTFNTSTATATGIIQARRRR